MPGGLSASGYFRSSQPLLRNISQRTDALWIASADVGEPYCIGIPCAITFQIKVDAKMHWKTR